MTALMLTVGGSLAAALDACGEEPLPLSDDPHALAPSAARTAHAAMPALTCIASPRAPTGKNYGNYQHY
jgi:hypothetical protein